GADRLAAVANPEGDRSEYAYDATDNLVSQTDGGMSTTTLDYDPLNRRTLLTYPDGASESRSYDGEGNVVEEVDAKGHVASFAYDALNREVLRSYRESSDIADATHSYDALNRVTGVLVPGSGSTSYGYGLLQTISYPNGTSADYTYDASNRVATIENRHNTAALVSSFSYSYDGNGNRVEQIETQGGQAPETTTYAYDGADRLTQVSYPEKVTSYTYDGAGNRLTETETDPGGGSVLADKVYAYNSRNQLTGVED
ncbi:MAG: RHS repeat protein, partial [Ketobacter sp.]|nr:RHS repeat protein [Ketobacter sp.]